MINYYSSIFCSRERVYLKTLGDQDGNIYWLEDNHKQISAVALLDPKYRFENSEVNFLTIGHTISNKVGEMDKLLYHVFTDHEDDSMFLLCKEFVAETMGVGEYGMVNFTSLEIRDLMPELANARTDYFNVTHETLFDGMVRKNHHGFIKISNPDLEKIKTTNPKLYETYNQKLEAVNLEIERIAAEMEESKAMGYL
jgi:hypothetical protein